jgi:hypothetical protein
MASQSPKVRRKTWYLLPIFMNIIGGVIAYFVIRQDDPQKAKRCLIIGASIFAVNIVVGIGFAPSLLNPLTLFEGTIQESIVDLEFNEEKIEVIMNSQAKFLAVRNDPLVIPINNIIQVHNTLPKQSSSDLRMPGTAIPGSIKAGTYLTENDNKEFWFIKTRDSNSIITIELKDHEFDRIVVESEKSKEWIERINKIISSSKD